MLMFFGDDHYLCPITKFEKNLEICNSQASNPFYFN
jgi:hypothetical protein